MRNIFILFSTLSLSLVFSQQENTTLNYPDLISTYKTIAKNNKDVSLYQMGQSDYGVPIYLCVLGSVNDSLKDFQNYRVTTSLLINNGIHAGEPCGVNASLQIVEEYILKSSKEKKNFPSVAIIPAYNVGGMHNRNSTSRANQEGPEEYGFRGNARNLDLNRDFIKTDSKNMETFAKIYHGISPDIFIDTHTSNGADYQYTITYIASIYERTAPSLQNLIFKDLLPSLTKNIKEKHNYDLFPYIEMKGSRIDEGIVAFNDLPRYSMGYAALFNSISFTTETHMLKPFDERVKSTYAFLEEIIKYAAKNSSKIEEVRKAAFNYQKEQKEYAFDYVLDEEKNKWMEISFKGFEHSELPSEITSQKRLFYDRTKPYEKDIPFYFHFKAQQKVRIPAYYIVKASEEKVLQRLALNKVEIKKIEQDSTLLAEQLKVVAYESRNTPYEGHFLHYNTKLEKTHETLTLRKGDVIVPTNQINRNFIVSVLEPSTEDSYFNWNFFDSYLQQKEYFSPYVFEEKAIEVLENNPKLKEEYSEKKKNDPEFANSRWDQLFFIYINSGYHEKSFAVLPVYKSVN